MADKQPVQDSQASADVKTGQDAAPAQPSPLQGEVLVDWGDGVHRKMDAKALVEAAKASSESKRAIQEARALQAQAAQAMGLAKAFEELSPDRRRMLARVLENPDLLDSTPSRRQSDDDDLDLDYSRAETPQRKGPDPVIADLQAKVRELTGYISKQEEQSRRQGLETQVRKAMDSYEGTFDGFEKSYIDRQVRYAMQDVAQGLGDVETIVARMANDAAALKGVTRPTQATSAPNVPTSWQPAATGQNDGLWSESKSDMKPGSDYLKRLSAAVEASEANGIQRSF